jgi:hypothetical protein
MARIDPPAYLRSMALDLTDDEQALVTKAMQLVEARALAGEHAAQTDLQTARRLLHDGNRHILKHAQGILDDEEQSRA